MKVLILTLCLMFFSAFYVNAQTPEDTKSQLAECSQFLDQSLEEVKSCKDKAEKYLDEIYSLRGTISISEKEILRYESLVKKLDARIEYLEKKKCTEIRILFFLVKVRWC